VLERLAEPVCVVDAEGVVRFANAAAATALGYAGPRELEGRPMDVRLTGEELDWMVRRDGTRVRTVACAAPIDLPAGPATIITFHEPDPGGSGWVGTDAARAAAVAREEAARSGQRRGMAAADAARRRLSQDLHDGVQQDLVTVVVSLQLAQQAWDADRDRARELVDLSTEHAKLAVSQLRELSAGIHPAILSHRGLGPAVEALATRLPLPVSVEQAPHGRFAPAVEAGLYFLIGEALTNVVKHAHATAATVRFELTGPALAVEVCDDGVGGATPSATGSGLAGLHDRAAALDGTLVLESPPGSGTRVRAEVPVSPPLRTSTRSHS
jgi:signal transduction histidine kinase